MPSVRDKFVKVPKISVCLTIAEDTKYTQLQRAPSGKTDVTFATVEDANWRRNNYKLNKEVDKAAVHTRLVHIPYKRYEQLFSMTDVLPHRMGCIISDDVCEGCCVGKLRAETFGYTPRSSSRELMCNSRMYRDVMDPTKTKTPGSCKYVVTFFDDFSRHVIVHFMKMNSDFLSKFKICKAEIDSAMDKTAKLQRPCNGVEYIVRQFKSYHPVTSHTVRYEPK
ncbi:Gag-pol Polyprotein [Phytophthora megakarya]|uniref:Gag-pol Polyprotein n=1 Tax=Phytophthora megakarya TaxID=4795 RepID=A0A225X599_9STRA|nr:Gag-pol Polyprotein [Phytophthora megakarya]